MNPLNSTLDILTELIEWSKGVGIYDFVNWREVWALLDEVYGKNILNRGASQTEYRKCYYSIRNTLLAVIAPEQYKEHQKLRRLLGGRAL